MNDSNNKVKPEIKQIIPVIEEWVRFFAFYNEVPGVSIAIQQYDEILTEKAFGKKDLEAGIDLSSDTRFRIASHSKVFTATAIMELYAEEKLSLDDKVTKYLDWFEPEEDNIRIRHLLTHSSGITRDGEFGHWHHHRFPTLDQFKEMLNSEQEVEILDPAVQIKYSNIAFTLLGQVIEAITGDTYENYMYDLIERLGLEHTTPEIGTTEDLHSKGYKMRIPGEKREAFEHVEAKVMNAATGFSSTPRDILRFYRAQMLGQDEDLKYGDFYKREMQNLQFKTDNTEWGLGFMRVNPHKTVFLGHGGGYPGFITFSGFNPDRELGIAVFTNTLAPPEIVGGMVGLLRYAEDNFEGYADDTDHDFSSYEGVYRNKWAVILVKQFNNQLLICSLHTENPKETIQRLKHVEDNIFKIEDANPNAGKGEMVYFKEDEIHTRGLIYYRFEYNY